MVEPDVWPEELLHDLSRTIYSQLVLMRRRAKSWRADLFPCAPRDCRRGFGSLGAGDAGRRIPGLQTGGGFWSL